jgi:hypothetical protein
MSLHTRSHNIPQCMEKGLKTLQTAARTAHRKFLADNQPMEDRGISDHNSDSGIGFGSETEMEAVVEAGPSTKTKSSSWHAPEDHSQQLQHQEHYRSRSLPMPLPLYQPPPPIVPRRTFEGTVLTTSPQDMVFHRPSPPRRCSPDSQNGRVSIQSVLSS